jgi:NAD(P)H-nitrite reductase large subunit
MPLEDDDTVCYCFHVPKRKIVNFCRNQKPRHASQISDCLSAGTGCGWCVPLLKKMHKEICGTNEPWWRQQSQEPSPPTESTSDQQYDSAEAYAAARQSYIARKKSS